MAADPLGRIIDVEFGREVSLHAPLDRIRFDIDMVRPVRWPGSFNGIAFGQIAGFVGDINNDGIPDLLTNQVFGGLAFFPGQEGEPLRFGFGDLLRQESDDISLDPYHFGNVHSEYSNGDIGDLDGDSQPEMVLGYSIYYRDC